MFFELIMLGRANDNMPSFRDAALARPQESQEQSNELRPLSPTPAD